MREFIKLLEKHNLLQIIDKEVDTELEIAHLAYVEAKKKEGKALLFTKPVNKKENKSYDFPVLMNTFCNEKALNLAFGTDYESLANELSSLLKMHIPSTLFAKLSLFKKLVSLKSLPPKRLKKEGDFTYQNIASLQDLPILKTWQDDAGKFITMAQVYTQSLDKKQNNLGMYRLQVLDDKRLLMHWQIHKDASHFYHEYKKANKKMPVSIAIGGDPLYIWCAQAPLPKGIFELLLYGFIKKQNALLSPCENSLFVPYNSDIVIEGFVDPNELELEGPFGDHTGFYTPKEAFPVLRVSSIKAKKDAIYQATVVGKPPLEDKIMALGTERLFLPLLQTSVPDLLDYNMPENGVFHNLILAKINSSYPAHAQQIMHAFWGVGQLSFVKHAIFVNKDAPELKDYDKLIPYMLNRFDLSKLLISEGICDQLDHASFGSCHGGKAGIDLSSEGKNIRVPKLLDDDSLKKAFEKLFSLKDLRQFYTESKNPITCIVLDKKQDAKELFTKALSLKEHFKILILLGEENRLKNPYMLVWRVLNNIDAKRDFYIKEDLILINAQIKDKSDGYEKEWPKQTDCSKEVLKELINRGLLKEDKELFNSFELCYDDF